MATTEDRPESTKARAGQGSGPAQVIHTRSHPDLPERVHSLPFNATGADCAIKSDALNC